jgi:hypothetical protein
VIARTWRGGTRLADADEHIAYLHRTGQADSLATPENGGFAILGRDEDDRTEFLTLSLCDYVEAIGAFAGDDAAVVFDPDDDRYLIDRESLVSHDTVASFTGETKGRWQP